MGKIDCTGQELAASKNSLDMYLSHHFSAFEIDFDDKHEDTSQQF